MKGGTGPTIKKGKSNQAVETPWEFIRAIEKRFGPIYIDLAATKENAKTRYFITPERNTFTQNWASLLDGGLGYLNPEFDPMRKWVIKCAFEQQRLYSDWEDGEDKGFLVLTPLSIGSNWFWQHVRNYATTYCLYPRIVFDNCYDEDGELITDPYPKDLMLNHYSPNPSKELFRWDWLTDELTS